MGDLVEPLDTYYKHYNTDSQESIARNLTIWHSFQASMNDRDDARD